MVTATAAGASNGRALISIHPRLGIGPVRLDETHRKVDAALGPGQLIKGGIHDGAYGYRSGSITVEVSYDAQGHVNGVNTASGAALLFGHRLREGLGVLKPILRAHGWRVLSCHGETFTALIPGGPGTGIAWKNGKLDEVQIDAGGSIGEECLPY
jgi:hypothetical protein